MKTQLRQKDLDLYNDYWVQSSRLSFYAFRKYMRGLNFKDGWFVRELSFAMQQFFVDLCNKKRPILIVQVPPQHGKSLAVIDFIAWIYGRLPHLRTIFASYSDTLGVRCNLAQQRFFKSDKYKTVFPDITIPNKKGMVKINSNQLEFIDRNYNLTGGQFRNTTVAGAVTGESLDLGVIDDAVKGREQAMSMTWSDKIWDWYCDDFSTRFSEYAGLLIAMTRWSTHDVVGRILETDEGKKAKVINYEAIASKDEPFRKEGEALFPSLKSREFLLKKKATMSSFSWTSLYKGSPIVQGGGIIKDEYWRWYTALPKLMFKFITVDSAQKTKTQNDYTVMQCWGFGVDKNIYLIDKKRARLESPELRIEAEIFYKKHDLKKEKVDDPILRFMAIEDKSSGSGLIQELKRKRMRIVAIQRNVDKYLRVSDGAPFIESGRVWLNADIPGIDNLTQEAREFPNGAFDDDIDTCITAIEVSFINKTNIKGSLLAAAMEMDN